MEALLTLGVLLILVGLIGQVKAKEIEVGTKSPFVRIILGLLGVLFVSVALSKILSLPATSTPSPTSVNTSIVSSIPTPSPTRENISPVTSNPISPTIVPIPGVQTIYDNFSNTAYDGNFDQTLWNVWRRSDNSTISQQNGILKISEQTTSTGDTSLTAINYANQLPTTPTFLEAKTKLVSNIGEVGLIISDSKFRIICSIYNQNAQESAVICVSAVDSFTTLGKVSITSANDWHTLRMEIYPDTMTFTCQVDNHLIYSGVPPKAINIEGAGFALRIGISSNGQNSEATVGYFDDVRIGSIGK